jgi:hypothetical protein
MDALALENSLGFSGECPHPSAFPYIKYLLSQIWLGLSPKTRNNY